MNFRGLIIAVVTLGISSGVLYWSQHRKPPEVSANPSSTAAPAILKIDRADITQVTIRQKSGEPVTLGRTKTDTWQITQPKPYSADQETIAGLLSTLSALNADRVVEDKISDRKQYGLDPASVEVTINGKEGKMRQLLLGDDTPAGGDSYAVLAGDPRVFTIATYNKSSLDKSLNDLRNKKLFDFGFNEPDKIELHSGLQSWDLTRSGHDWSSNGKKVDASGVESLVSKLRDLSAISFVSSGFVHPDIRATVTSDEGKQVEEVLISKSGSISVAKRGSEPTLYQLASGAAEDLPKLAAGIKPAAVAGK
jgi:Domain of unknown function (DUF4340)